MSRTQLQQRLGVQYGYSEGYVQRPKNYSQDSIRSRLAGLTSKTQYLQGVGNGPRYTPAVTGAPEEGQEITTLYSLPLSRNTPGDTLKYSRRATRAPYTYYILQYILRSSAIVLENNKTIGAYIGRLGFQLSLSRDRQLGLLLALAELYFDEVTRI